MIYIVFLYFLSLIYITLKIKSKLAGYLIGVYTFSIAYSIILYNTDVDDNFKFVTATSSIVFCLTLLFYFAPFFKNNIVIKPDNTLSFRKNFMIIGYGLSFVLIIASIFLSTKIQEAFAYGLLETREAMYREESVYTKYTMIEHIGHSTLKWLGGLSYTLLIMFFYAFSFINKKRILKISMLVSSLSATYLGLLVGGRTNLMYWVLFFIFCLILFWPYFNIKKKKVIFFISFIFLTLLSAYFILITVGRAEIGYEGETDSFLKLYIGQPFLNFCYFFENLNFHPYTTSRIFPLTNNLLFGRFNLSEYRDLIAMKSGMNIGIFYTFLGDIYVDMGLIGMLLYSFAYFFISKKIMRKNIFTLPNLLILGIMYQIPLHGVFYYSLWKMESSVCILFTIIIAKFLQHNKINKWKD